MRGSDALEKVCRARPELLRPFTARLLAEVPRVDQPSVQWHPAQILSSIPLRGAQERRAVAVLEQNLERDDDWIVVNLTLEALGVFARRWPEVRIRLIDILATYARDRRKSVAKRATRPLGELGRSSR